MSEHISEQTLQNRGKSLRIMKLGNLALLGVVGIYIFLSFLVYSHRKQLDGIYVEGILPEDYCEVYHATEERAATILRFADINDITLLQMSTEDVVKDLGEPDQVFRVRFRFVWKSQGTVYKYWLKYDKSEDTKYLGPKYLGKSWYEGLEFVFDSDNKLVMLSMRNRYYVHRHDNTRKRQRERVSYILWTDDMYSRKTPNLTCVLPVGVFLVLIGGSQLVFQKKRYIVASIASIILGILFMALELFS